jgi:hypothetical protein
MFVIGCLLSPFWIGVFAITVWLYGRDMRRAQEEIERLVVRLNGAIAEYWVRESQARQLMTDNHRLRTRLIETEQSRDAERDRLNALREKMSQLLPGVAVIHTGVHANETSV